MGRRKGSRHITFRSFCRRRPGCCTTWLLYHMGRIFRDNVLPPSNPLGIRVDSKRRRKLMERRMAAGHKLDDHEERQDVQRMR